MQLGLLPQELSPATVLSALQARRGAANGITARDLVYVITGRVNAADERRLRQVIEQLRNDGNPICAHPALGYHWAANATELEKACHYLISRATTSLRQACAMRRVSLPDLYGQLGLKAPDHEDPSHD